MFLTVDKEDKIKKLANALKENLKKRKEVPKKIER
jgi:hypothetical protein